MPGFIALQLFRAKYPAKKISEFLQVAWSLIYGVILATLVRGADNHFLHGWLQSGTPGFPASRFVVALVLAGLFLGVLLIGLNFARFSLAARWPPLEGIAPDPQSIWAKINRPSNDYASSMWTTAPSTSAGFRITLSTLMRKTTISCSPMPNEWTSNSRKNIPLVVEEYTSIQEM